MSLYLCIFSDETEIDGVDVGSYDDFNFLRETVVRELEGGRGGAVFPTFILHSDCEGEWSATDCVALGRELAEIAARFRALPSVGFRSDWQKAVGKALGLRPESLFDCFIDVDGEALLTRMLGLAEKAVALQLPILFQ